MTEEWKKLSANAHARLRAEVLFGSRDPHQQVVPEYSAEGLKLVETTWVPAVFTAFREILDNALDETILFGHGDRIDVTYDEASMTFSVTDNGRGIPIAWSDEHQKHAATVLLSEMNSGRNFVAERGESRGLNGIGAKGVNYMSEWFEVEVRRDKKHFKQRFREDVGADGEDLHVAEPPEIASTTSRKTGTRIACKLSPKVFHDLRLPEGFIAARMREVALCYPKLHLTYNGQRVEAKSPFGKNVIAFDIDEEQFKAKFFLLPEFVPEGEFAFSLVNAIPLFNGGTHIDAFRRGFHSGLLAALERESKKRKLLPNRADIGDGLLIYATLEMAAPSYDSQSKSRLINEHVGTRVRKMLDNPEFFRTVIKKHPEWIDAIYARCAERTQAKDGRDLKKQGKKNLRQKIEDLEDACGVDRSKCILFITEGKSAVAGCCAARDPQTCAAIPLRGKVRNVHGVTNKTILENEALAKLMGAIGLVPGERANRHALRYGKIYITTDADEDGKSIASLLLLFFHKCWPELFDPQKEPFIYIFHTPLIIACKGKQRKYWYSDNYHTFDPMSVKGWEIVRAKGLAALEQEDWRHALQNPKALPVIDDGKLGDVLNLLFDQDRAADRRAWIGI
jgi:DNA gyrase/topoisomerase IV subunit B